MKEINIRWIIIINTTKEIAETIGSDCWWNQDDFYDTDMCSFDCISISYIIYLILKNKYWINVMIKSWSLKEWLTNEFKDDILSNTWHFWCEYDNMIIDLTVSQFIDFIDNYDFLYNNIKYWHYIFDKQVLNNYWVYSNWKEALDRIIELNKEYMTNIWNIDYSKDLKTILKQFFQI